MKKLFALLLTLFFGISGTCFAQENKTPINFIYVHGSDQGTVEEFDIWINRMHPYMKKNLEANQLVQEHLLKDAYIKKDKDMLYWADKTQKDKSIVEMGLKISKIVSSCVAQLARSTLAHLLHDAIWLQKYVNMKPILAELNKKVIENHNAGEKDVLVGYSAGTFITYQYLLNKLKIFDLADFMERYKDQLNVTDDDIIAFKNTKIKSTCIDAVVDSKVLFLGADGNLITNSNKQDLRNNFKKLKQQNEISCAPDNSVAGIINFGSPLVIFYSDNYPEDSQMYYFFLKLTQYIIENNMFALTVNYKTDPLGVPSENVSISSAKGYKIFDNMKINGGFIYDASVNGGIMFVSSHLKYWDQVNHFTKAIAKSYEEGYKYFYELDKKEK